MLYQRFPTRHNHKLIASDHSPMASCSAANPKLGEYMGVVLLGVEGPFFGSGVMENVLVSLLLGCIMRDA